MPFPVKKLSAMKSNTKACWTNRYSRCNYGHAVLVFWFTCLYISTSAKVYGFSIPAGCGKEVYLDKSKSPILSSSTTLHTADKAFAISDFDANFQSANGSAHSPVNSHGGKRHIVPCLTAIIIGSFSIAEIVESSREITRRSFHHGHGLAILAIIRLSRAIAILQTQMDEFKEGTEKLGVTFEKRTSNVQVSPTEAGMRSITAFLARVVFSPVTTISACVLAALASIIEIVDDMKPGAHHGAALLALSELHYQFHRLQQVTGGKQSTWTSRRFPGLLSNPILRKVSPTTTKLLSKIAVRTLIALAAASFAVVEIVEDMQPGGHHAVAVLAAAEFVENINRSRVLKKALTQ